MRQTLCKFNPDILGHLKACDRILKLRIPNGLESNTGLFWKPPEEAHRGKYVNKTEGLLISQVSLLNPAALPFSSRTPTTSNGSAGLFFSLPLHPFLFKDMGPTLGFAWNSIAIGQPPSLAGGEFKSGQYLACTFFLLSLIHKIIITPHLQVRKLRQEQLRHTDNEWRNQQYKFKLWES